VSDVAIRPYAPSDRDAVREICLRTGDAGGDATGTTPDDRLLPDTYALPYVDHAPDLAFVVDDGGGRAAGYVLGVADTAAFVRWYRAGWAPGLAERYAHLDAAHTAVRQALDPERMLVPELAEYPAHLHIDLLPPLQRRGLGRRLIEHECAALAAAGASGVHLGVAAGNADGLAFYPRVGFTRVRGDGDSVLFVRPLDGESAA